MYFETIVLIRKAQKSQHANFAATKHDHRIFLFLSTGLLCLITVYLFAQNFFGEEMWIIHAGYAGGSGQYYADHAAVWYQTMGSAASVVLNWMSDAFLVRPPCVCLFERSADRLRFTIYSCQIYRLYRIWDENLFAIIAPSLLYAGTVGVSSPPIHAFAYF